MAAIVIRSLAICVCCGIPGFGRFAVAEDGPSAAKSRVTASTDWPLKAVDSMQREVLLPEPPAEIAKWIRLGKVRLEFYDPAQKRTSFDGETQFEYRYDFRCRSEWKRVQIDGQSGLEIRVNYSAITLEVTHLVRLPEKMIPNVFEQPLTRHEFDHVRISAQPGLDKTLKSMMVRRNEVIRHVLDPEEDEFNSPPTDTDLQRICNAVVSHQSDAVFEDFTELVKIRYRELDRLSRYGVQKLTDEERETVINAPIRAESVAAER